MAKECQISKKKGLVGNNVSHSKRRTKRRQEVNLQWKKFWDPSEEKWVRLRVCTNIVKSINKKGLSAVLKIYQ